MVVWERDRISTRDSVEIGKPLSGARLREAYTEALPRLTLGLVRFKGNSMLLGPLELHRFGKPTVTRTSVEWPIEGGLLGHAHGGQWRIHAGGGRVEATATGYWPRLPRPLYDLTQLQVHLLFTRLFLLGLRERGELPGEQATSSDRAAAAIVDAALCFSLARFAGRRTPKRVLAVAAVYHVVCWTISGRTLGGAVMRQRVVSVDGSRLLPQQAALRFLMLPLSWIAWRPLHDRIAGTIVIKD